MGNWRVSHPGMVLVALPALFALTWSPEVARAALLVAATLGDIWRDLSITVLVSAACLGLAYWNSQRCERLAKERGTLVLY